MRELRGGTALVTGSSGGIGTHIARALAREGMNVVVSGRREEALNAVTSELSRLGVRAASVPADLGDLDQARGLIARVEELMGPLDVLVNNAGVEYASAFASMPEQELTGTIDVNLTAPMLLTRRVLPGMLARRRGHVVFISSMAGKIGSPYEVAYSASKAGLIAFSNGLRAEYLHEPVGFSVICPGFVEGDGMYQRMVDQGIVSNRLIGATTTDKIAAKVVRAIRRNVPEVVESGSPIKPMLALAQLVPRLPERALPAIGLTDMFRRGAEVRRPPPG